MSKNIVCLCIFAFTSWLFPAEVNGRLINGTTGEPGSAEQVMLIDLQAGFTVVSATSDVVDTFALEIPTENKSNSFLIQARKGNTLYSAKWDGASDDEVALIVFDAAVDVPIQASLGSLAIFAYESSVDIGCFYNLDNASDPPLVLDNPQGNYAYQVIPGYKQVDVSTRFGNNMPLRQAAPEGSGAAVLSYSLKPGRTQLIVTTTHEYTEASGLEVEVPIAEGQTTLRMLVLPSDLHLLGEGVEFIDRDSDEDVALYEWTASPTSLKPRIKITGKPAPSRQMQTGNEQKTETKSATTLKNPERIPDRLGRYRWWIIGLVIGICSLMAIGGSRRH